MKLTKNVDNYIYLQSNCNGIFHLITDQSTYYHSSGYKPLSVFKILIPNLLGIFFSWQPFYWHPSLSDPCFASWPLLSSLERGNVCVTSHVKTHWIWTTLFRPLPKIGKCISAFEVCIIRQNAKQLIKSGIAGSPIADKILSLHLDSNRLAYIYYVNQWLDLRCVPRIWETNGRTHLWLRCTIFASMVGH